MFLLITFIYFNNLIRLYKNYFPSINQNNFQYFKKIVIILYIDVTCNRELTSLNFTSIINKFWWGK